MKLRRPLHGVAQLHLELQQNNRISFCQTSGRMDQSEHLGLRPDIDGYFRVEVAVRGNSRDSGIGADQSEAAGSGV